MIVAVVLIVVAVVAVMVVMVDDYCDCYNYSCYFDC